MDIKPYFKKLNICGQIIFKKVIPYCAVKLSENKILENTLRSDTGYYYIIDFLSSFKIPKSKILT